MTDFTMLAPLVDVNDPTPLIACVPNEPAIAAAARLLNKPRLREIAAPGFVYSRHEGDPHRNPARDWVWKIQE